MTASGRTVSGTGQAIDQAVCTVGLVVAADLIELLPAVAHDTKPAKVEVMGLNSIARYSFSNKMKALNADAELLQTSQAFGEAQGKREIVCRDGKFRAVVTNSNGWDCLPRLIANGRTARF